MRRLLRKTLSGSAIFLLGLAFSVGLSRAADEDDLPFWLAMQKGEGRRSHWQKKLDIDGEVKAARLRLTGDFASVHATLNSTDLVPLEAFDPVLEIDVKQLLKVGENSLFLTCFSTAGPSAVAARLEIELNDGERIVVISDSSWRCTHGDFVDSDTVTRGRVDSRRWALNRLPDIDAFAEYNQWKEALPEDGESSVALDEKLSPLPAGFHIERLHTALPGEGSWVSMAVDEKGRMIIARETKGLLRLSMPEEGDGEFGVEVINDTLEECRGLAFRDSDLFANANRSKALYRLRDTTGDDQFNEVTLLQSTEGGTGHGRNDLALGPDGKIHAIHGDSVLVPENADRRTVPEPEGQAPKHLGHWLRTDGEPVDDGKGNWEILARGLRNPYGIDFNEDGEAFTYDADNEGDVGLPFYRPTRINHLVSGANYGWHQQRGNTRSMPVYAPDSVPTTFDVGRGSPTAVKFGTRSNFPEYWRQALFALDWAYGRIVAVHMTPRGASYYGTGELFLEGRPLNVTDLDFLPDGSMVFVTGGRKTQSALYRVSYVGEAESEPAVSDQARSRAEFSQQARLLRQNLEKYHGRVTDDAVDAVDAVWPFLGDEDPWIRNAARVALEFQPVDGCRKRVKAIFDKEEQAMEEERRQRGVTAGYRTGPPLMRSRGDLIAMLSLARVGTDEDREMLVNKQVVSPALTGKQLWGVEGARVLERCTDALKVVSEKRSVSALFHLSWPENLPVSHQREHSRLLSMVGAPEAVAVGMQLMSSADDQMLRLHYLEMLSEASAGWDAESRERYFRALIDAEKSSLGDRFMAGFFDTVKRHALANIADDDERSRYADLLETANKADATAVGEALPDPEPREFVQHWLMKDFPADDLAKAIAKESRDPDSGKLMFSAGLCNRCHVAGSEGRSMGPDLTTVGRRFSPRDLLESIIEPSKVVAEVHRTVTITLKDGSTVNGRIIGDDFRQSLLTLGVNPFDPSERRQIAKGNIERSEEMSVSPMPTGLLDTLSQEQVFDLLAWLIHGEEKNGQLVEGTEGK